jgi:hypothetical protein
VRVNSGRPSGFFGVEQIDGVWWLTDPKGDRFLSKGVNNVCWDPDTVQNTDRVPYLEACRRKYGRNDAWRVAAARRLASWGFNSLGAWSDEAVAIAGPRTLAFAPVLDLAATFKSRHRRIGRSPGEVCADVFDRDFELHARRRADEICTPRRTDPGLIGWFSDNELCWGPDWRGGEELLTIFLNLSVASPGRREAIELLRGRHSDFDSFNLVWRTDARSWEELASSERVAAPFRRKAIYDRDEAVERKRNEANPRRASFVADCEAFVAAVAVRYFAVTSAAIKAVDPNHLLLGSRFAYVPQSPVIDAAGEFGDVISFNCYDLDPAAAIDAYARTGKPCLIGEFSFRGDDSGLPNTVGAGPRVSTQADRANAFRHYVTAGLRKPTLVGYHWFEHADEPAQGRFDGENSNYGVVTVGDEIYEDLVQAMTAGNQDAERVHGTAAHAAPDGTFRAATKTATEGNGPAFRRGTARR